MEAPTRLRWSPSLGSGDVPPAVAEGSEYRSFKLEQEGDYNNMYWQRTAYMDMEDDELSWFNAGVRVGVGIGLLHHRIDKDMQPYSKQVASMLCRIHKLSPLKL